MRRPDRMRDMKGWQDVTELQTGMSRENKI